MDPKRLAAKQKRYNDWKRFSEEELQDPSLKPVITANLTLYRSALAEVWKTGGADEALTTKVESLERTLEDLNNEARLRVPGRLRAPGTPRTPGTQGGI